MAKKNILLQSRRKKAQALFDSGQLDAAQILFEQLAVADRVDPDIRLTLGIIAGRLGDHARAAEHFRCACTLRPGHAPAHFNLGIALRESGRTDAAAVEFARTLALQPDHVEAHECLAHTLSLLSDLPGAIEALRTGLRLFPNRAEWHVCLAGLLRAQGQLEDAIASNREALRLNPALPLAYANLGSALGAQGRFDEALTCYRESLQRFPQDHHSHSNLLQTLNYLPDADPTETLQEHMRWGNLHATPAPTLPANNTPADPQRRLRVGLVSPDFRAHSVAFFVEPLLQAIDRKAVELVCYSDVPRHDEVTCRLKTMADEWRDIYGLPDDAVASQVHADGIDILVDLAGHTPANRLRVFARKPAAVQVSYLGYPNTTGLVAMDYRLSDAVADPEGEDRWHVEKLVRLPGSFLCYRPPVDAPEVAALPALEAGHVTFGSFNNLAKIGADVIALWARLTASVPGARLLIKNPSLTDAATRERYHAMFALHGLDRDRVELIGHTPTQAEHLALYGRVDIALDTFPYNGTTTTCEALWMGVPVVTLAGRRHAGRVGASLLCTIGHSEWMTNSADTYVAVAAGLATDLDALSTVRAALRDEVAASALCNSEGFARKMVSALREMWRSRCEGDACEPENTNVSNLVDVRPEFSPQ